MRKKNQSCSHGMYLTKGHTSWNNQGLSQYKSEEKFVEDILQASGGFVSYQPFTTMLEKVTLTL